MNPARFSTTGSRKAGPIHAYLLFLANCVSPLAAVLIVPILPQMQAHFAQVPRVEFLVPLALTVPGLVIALLSLFVGVIADRMGRKRLLVGGLLLFGAFGIAPLWLDSLHAILATRIGLGFAEALIMTCCTALIGDYYEGQQRDRYLALNFTFSSTSAVIFIAVGGALGELGWRVPFAIHGIILCLVPAALFLLWEPQRKADDVPEPDGAATLDAVWRPWLLIGICAVTLLGSIAFMVLPVHIAYLLAGIGVTSPSTVGLVGSGSQAAVIVGTLLFPVLLRAGVATAARLGIAFGAIGIGFVVTGLASSVTGVTAGAAIAGVGGGILLPTLLCWNMENLPPRHRGLGAGAWNAAFFLGNFLPPIVVIGIAGMLGGLAETVQLLGVVSLVGAVFILVVALSRGSKRLAVAQGDGSARPVANK